MVICQNISLHLIALNKLVSCHQFYLKYIYIYELVNRLCHSGYGCKDGHWYYGTVGCAYDVSLVAPSIYSNNNNNNLYSALYSALFN